MTRRRSRRTRRPTTLGVILFACGILMISLVAWGPGMGTASFSTADAPRSGSVDMVTDDAAAHSLDVAGSVRIDATDPLVNVTNQLGKDVTMTVTLRDDSTHIGDLVVDGTTEGNQALVELAEQNTQAVEIVIENDTSLTSETVYFHVNASAPGLDVSAPDRTVPVVE